MLYAGAPLGRALPGPHRPGAAHDRRRAARASSRRSSASTATSSATGRCCGRSTGRSCCCARVTPRSDEPPVTPTILPAEGRSRAARASTTASCSCRRSAGARSPRSTRSAARSTTSSTRRSDAGVARTKLAWWRERGRAASTTAQPQHPVARALAEVVGPYGLEEAQLQEVIDGMEMDLEYNALSRFRRAEGVLPPRRRRGRHAVGEDLRLPGSAHARVRGRPRARLPAHQHHPRRGRGRAAQPHLPAAARARANTA